MIRENRKDLIMKLRKQLAILGLGTALGLTFAAPSAHAFLVDAGTANGVSFWATDQNVACVACVGTQVLDTDLTPGILQYVTTQGGVQITNVRTVQNLGTLGGQNNTLGSASDAFINTNPGPVGVTLAMGATGYTPPARSVTTSGSGTFVDALGGAASLRWWDDPLNRQGATSGTTTPGILVDGPFNTGTITANPQSYSHNGGPFAVVDNAPFSMTEQLILALPGCTQPCTNLNAAPRLISQGEAEVKPVAAVPEPASLLLLGTGLFALGWGLRKRRPS